MKVVETRFFGHDWNLPADFCTASDDAVQAADAVLFQLLYAREKAVGADVKEKRVARQFITRLHAAMHGIDSSQVKFRQRVLWMALEESCSKNFREQLEPNGMWTLDHRCDIAGAQLRAVLPDVTISRQVLRRAVELWDTKGRGDRSNAVRALAKELDCDSNSLMTKLRQAASKYHAQTRDLQRKRYETAGILKKTK